MDWNYLNDPTKTIIRQLLVAKAKETLGLIRGTFSGKIHLPQAEATMDYQMLITQGQKEYDAAMQTLEKRLEKLTPEYLTEREANIVKNTMERQKGTPLGIYMI